ncbi:Pisatin demethylase [Cyphellophora attinorum]|uniref:Pisatin demethylase n=1 Tax=Cyphellophora attinorum TaxID=1664694 RepID=A0A0N1HK86_9EURO|nr:Pisatin demethylase [Phialophora attinorum]KPI34587.1 Pisatin demethylase [Phialophora attinorum]
MFIYGHCLNVLDLTAAALLLFTLAAVIRRHLALRHIPGPFLASLTDIWLLCVMRFGDYRQTTASLAARYPNSKLIRYGPHRVLFSDQHAIPLVYGTTKPFPKAASYNTVSPYIPGRGVVSTLLSSRDETQISAIKRHIAHVFSTTAVLEFEHHIDDSITQLLAALASAGPQVNLQHDDTPLASRTAAVADTSRGGQIRFAHWNNWLAAPYLESLVFKNPLLAHFARPELITTIAAKRVVERTEKGGAAFAHADLLDRFFQAQQKDPELFSNPRIVALALAVVHGGTETTAHSLTILFYLLLRHPKSLARVQQEIGEATFSRFPPPYTEAANQLPYLEACIKEAQRVQPLQSGPTEREVPVGGVAIAGTFLPGGTVVSLNKAALQLDRSVFDPHDRYDVHEFLPERWLDGIDAAQASLMNRTNFAFSHGKRVCLGVHLAWAEMLKVTASLLMRFEVQLVDPGCRLEVKRGMTAIVTGRGLPVLLRERV